MVWFLPSECQGEGKKKVSYLSLFCFKLSVLLHSQTVSLWLTETVTREKRLKKTKTNRHPHTAPKAAGAKERGRPTGNIRYHELQWARRQRCEGNWRLPAFRAAQLSPGKRGTRPRRGGGSLCKQAAQPRSGAFLLSISPPLGLGPGVASSAGNCPDGKTFKTVTVEEKAKPFLSDHRSKSAPRWWVKFSKGSDLLIVPESLRPPPPHTLP